MMAWIRIVARGVLFGGMLTLAACGSRTIPFVAVEGTTFTLAVPDSYGAGFGRTLSEAMDATSLITALPAPAYDPGSSKEDLVRGELVFSLLDQDGSFLSYMPVNYITRIHPEETSGENRSQGQVIAFVDIPAGVVAANGGDSGFFWKVELLRRDLDDLDGDSDRDEFVDATPTYQGSPWTGWDGLAPTVGRIWIRESTNPAGNHWNQHYAWETIEGYGIYDVGADLEAMIPKPSIAVVAIKSGSPFSPAWAVELDYPEDKVSIVGVEVAANQKSGAVATLTHVTQPQGGCPTGNGRVRVSYVDPAALANSVRLVVAPRDFGCGAGRPTGADFLVDATTLVAYDVAGAPLSGYVSLVSAKLR